jgi:hypothetical protein
LLLLLRYELPRSLRRTTTQYEREREKETIYLYCIVRLPFTPRL